MSKRRRSTSPITLFGTYTARTERLDGIGSTSSPSGMTEVVHVTMKPTGSDLDNMHRRNKLDLSTLITHQEVFLRILGFMNAAELAGVQGVNRYWQAMSLDQQLWKKLYLSRYPHPHHTRLRPGPLQTHSIPRHNGANGIAAPPSASSSRLFRPISRLPSRAFPPPSPSPTPPRWSSHLSGYSSLQNQWTDEQPDPDLPVDHSAITEGVAAGPRHAGGPAELEEAGGEAGRISGQAALHGVGNGSESTPSLAGKGTGRAVPFVRPPIPLPRSMGGKRDPDGGSCAGAAMNAADRNMDEIGSGVRHEGVDWKMMLRLGTNWSTGSASQSASITLPPSPSPSTTSTSDLANARSGHATNHGHATPPSSTGLDTPLYQPDDGESHQHLALSPHLIFTSSPISPLVQVYSARVSSSSSSGRAGHDARPDASPASAAASSLPHLGIIPPPPGWSSPHRPDHVSAITVDQAISQDDGSDYGETNANAHVMSGHAAGSSSCRLAIFYASGGIVVLSVHPTSPSGTGLSESLKWTREIIQMPTSRPASIRRRATTYEPVHGDPVVLAQMYWPVLITCSRAFHVSVYSLSAGDNVETGLGEAEEGRKDGPRGRMTRLRTLHSDVSFHPASLSLFPADLASTSSDMAESTAPVESHADAMATSIAKYKAALTYCTPVYPSSWTVAVQELDIDLSPSALSPAWSLRSGNIGQGYPFVYGDGDVHRAFLFQVSRLTRHYEADAYAWPRPIRPIPSVKGIPRGIGSDGRWCVIAGREEQIEVFALPNIISHNGPPETQRPRGGMRGEESGIVHVQTLHLQGGVSAMELTAGRCVVAGHDGRVVVWDLDRLAETAWDEEGRGGTGNGDGGGDRDGWMGGRMLGYVEITSSRPLKRADTMFAPPSEQSEPTRKRIKSVRHAERRASRSHDHAAHKPQDTRDHTAHVSHPDDTDMLTDDDTSDSEYTLPHPAAITAAARAFFLPLPPTQRRDREREEAKGVRQVLHHVAFDEEKIVGMVRMPPTRVGGASAGAGGAGGERMKVWSFA